jgi:predicted transcriptional regulator
MRCRRRVLAETLIILASALVVLVLISSSPAEASGGAPVNPPVEPDPIDPSPNQGGGVSSQPEQTSENVQDDSTTSQSAESTEQPVNQAEENVTPNPGVPTSQPPISNPQPEPTANDKPETVNRVPIDESIIESTSNFEAIPEAVLQAIIGNDETTATDEEQPGTEATSEKEDVKMPFKDELNEIDDEMESVQDVDSESETLVAIEKEILIGPQELSEEETVAKEREVKDEPEIKESSSEKTERERSLTTSSGIKVVKIKVSSHIDKIVEEPITKFLFGMYTRLDTAEDLRGVRKKIYQYIKAHPGEHMATLMKEFKLSPSSISHHINVLEKNGFIISHNDGRYKRLFVNGNGYISTVSDNYKCQISALKNENAKKIVFFLMARPASTQYELSNALDLHPSTIHWHAKKLMSLGLISAIRDGKNIRYTVDDSTCVLKVLSVVETVRV